MIVKSFLTAVADQGGLSCLQQWTLPLAKPFEPNKTFLAITNASKPVLRKFAHELTILLVGIR